MRYILVVPMLFLLPSCGGEQPEERSSAPSSAPLRTIPSEDLWGRYGGLLPRVDGGEGACDLWLFADGGYVLQQAPSEAGGIPSGTFGRWTAVAGGLELDIVRGGRRPLRLLRTANGLTVDQAQAGVAMELIRKDASPTMDLPTMSVSGRYQEEAESHSFRPCGADDAYPLAVGEWLPALEVVRKASGAVTGPVWMRMEVSIGPAQAMEGDQPDTYLWMRGGPMLLKGDPCP